MRAKAFVGASALIYAIGGFALLFLPHELLAHGTAAPDAASARTAQLLGAALLGMAAMNWTARGAILGGIYGRAVMNGNFCFAFISAMTTVRALFDGNASIWLWLLAASSILLAAGFAYFLYGRPSAPAAKE